MSEATEKLQKGRTMGDGKEFIDRLLDGPDDVRLTAEELALFSSYLDNAPLSLSTVQAEKQATGTSPTLERLYKLRRIRDFNARRPTEGPAEPEGNMTEADALRSLLALYTQHVSDERFTAMAAILADPNRTIDEKLWEINRRIPIPPTADGPMLASVLRTTKQAIYRTTWWQRNRQRSDD